MTRVAEVAGWVWIIVAGVILAAVLAVGAAAVGKALLAWARDVVAAVRLARTPAPRPKPLEEYVAQHPPRSPRIPRRAGRSDVLYVEGPTDPVVVQRLLEVIDRTCR